MLSKGVYSLNFKSITSKCRPVLRNRQTRKHNCRSSYNGDRYLSVTVLVLWKLLIPWWDISPYLKSWGNWTGLKLILSPWLFKDLPGVLVWRLFTADVAICIDHTRRSAGYSVFRCPQRGGHSDSLLLQKGSDWRQLVYEGTYILTRLQARMTGVQFADIVLWSQMERLRPADNSHTAWTL